MYIHNHASGQNSTFIASGDFIGRPQEHWENRSDNRMMNSDLVLWPQCLPFVTMGCPVCAPPLCQWKTAPQYFQ